MTTTTNAKNLRRYESRFPSIEEQILAFASSTKLVTEVKNCLQISNEWHHGITDNSHSDR